jgi:hypothetical protein
MHWICTTCGTQVAASDAPPPTCAICEDARQYVPPSGQDWTTLDRLQRTHRNSFRRLEPGLLGVGTTPEFAIGQRALVVQSPGGNVLWDCVSLIDQATSDLLNGLGGVSAIAISHPHYYTTMLEFWSGRSRVIGEGLTLVHCGGHFAGGTVLHWARGADGRGALLTGDILQVPMDRRHVSFMRSYPNMWPLSRPAVESIAKAVAPYEYDRIYGAWWDRHIDTDAQAAVARSLERYVAALERDDPELAV